MSTTQPEALRENYTAADMATAAAQGFRDGVASVAASAGSEPVAHLWQHGETGRTRVLMPDTIVDADASWRLVGPLFLGSPPSPPGGVVGGWIALPGALPEPGTPVLLDIGKKYPIRATYYCPEGWREWSQHELTYWTISETPVAWCELPTPPSSAKGVAHG